MGRRRGGRSNRQGQDQPRVGGAGGQGEFRLPSDSVGAWAQHTQDQRGGGKPRHGGRHRPGGKGRGPGAAGGPGSAQNAKKDRLQKVMAQSGYGSRRNIEILIAQGHIKINGHLAQLGDLVGPNDRVLLDDRPVKLRFEDPLPRVLLYHKPDGEIVTRDDPEHRKTVFERLPRLKGGRWVSVGRLDINTGGLLIFTTSGELANRLMHPRYEVEREYAVRVLGDLTDELREKLLAGVEIEGELCKFDSIEDRGGEGANHWWHVVLREGKNREVRKLFDAVGLTVSRLMRVRYGQIVLPPELSRGHTQELDEAAVRSLLAFCGMNGGAGDTSQRREPPRKEQAQRSERPPHAGLPIDVEDTDGEAVMPDGEAQPPVIAATEPRPQGERPPRKNRRGGRRGRGRGREGAPRTDVPRDPDAQPTSFAADDIGNTGSMPRDFGASQPQHAHDDIPEDERQPAFLSHDNALPPGVGRKGGGGGGGRNKRQRGRTGGAASGMPISNESTLPFLKHAKAPGGGQGQGRGGRGKGPGAAGAKNKRGKNKKSRIIGPMRDDVRTARRDDEERKPQQPVIVRRVTRKLVVRPEGEGAGERVEGLPKDET